MHKKAMNYVSCWTAVVQTYIQGQFLKDVLSEALQGTVQYLERVVTSSKDSVRSQRLDGKKIWRLYNNLLHYSSKLYALILAQLMVVCNTLDRKKDELGMYCISTCIRVRVVHPNYFC